MITNQTPTARGGRLRTFENDDVFRATAALLARSGYGGLSLDAVAKEVGVSGPAISKRFGSKRGLLRAYLEWTCETVSERFRTMRARHASPLAALRARYLIPFDERPEELTAYAGWFDLRNDPELALILQRRQAVWETEAAALLDDARAAGELIEFDTDELAGALTAALVGATINWMGARDALPTRYAELLDTIIRPYRAAGGSAATTLPGDASASE